MRTGEVEVSKVVTLLAYGCPKQAIVAAFGLDERTVANWAARAGEHAQQVHEAYVQPLDLQQVQADEMRIKLQGQRVMWVAMALMVSTRLWLGAVVSPNRDKRLIDTLAALVRRWALFISFDGLAAYPDAFEHAFADPQKRPRGRPPRVV